MRLRRPKPEAVPPPQAPATPSTAEQGGQGAAEASPVDPSATPAAPAQQPPAPTEQQPASSGPGPVPGATPADGPRPPITGTHPVARPPAAPVSTEAEGQRAWLADLDRKLGTRSYAGAAAMVLSLAASIVAIVLAIDARDNSAGIDDLTRVENELAATVTSGTEAGEQALEEIGELQSRISTLEDQVAELNATINELGSRTDVTEDDIEDLRQQNAPTGGAGSP